MSLNVNAIEVPGHLDPATWKQHLDWLALGAREVEENLRRTELKRDFEAAKQTTARAWATAESKHSVGAVTSASETRGSPCPGRSRKNGD